jgi:hypothetical protein
LNQNESKQTKHTKHGYGERKVTTLDELKTLLWGLDLDEGIRFTAEVPGRTGKSFVFVTKCYEKICVSTKERIFDKGLNKFVPGGKEEWKYFENAEEAWMFITGLLKAPIEAYYY